HRIPGPARRRLAAQAELADVTADRRLGDLVVQRPKGLHQLLLGADRLASHHLEDGAVTVRLVADHCRAKSSEAARTAIAWSTSSRVMISGGTNRRTFGPV